jgi:hypothetical protein
VSIALELEAAVRSDGNNVKRCLPAVGRGWLVNDRLGRENTVKHVL